MLFVLVHEVVDVHSGHTLSDIGHYTPKGTFTVSCEGRFKSTSTSIDLGELVATVCPQSAVPNPEICRVRCIFLIEESFEGEFAQYGLNEVGAVQTVEAVGSKYAFLQKHGVTPVDQVTTLFDYFFVGHEEHETILGLVDV